MAAIAHLPEPRRATCGVVIVVGGPQYRVGSHRQFVLLARELAAQGIPVLRFDLPGMGDSSGDPVGFERADSAIRAAVDCLVAAAPGIDQVCLWGLCDGAAAALMYAPSDARVSALVLANPWVRSESGLAQSYLDAYYGRRLRSAAFWRKIVRDPATAFKAAVGLVANLRRASGRKAESRQGSDDRSFLGRMLRGGEHFRGRMLVLLSGRDLVATEFELALGRWQRWASAFSGPRVRIEKHPEANHTFSRREWRDWVAARTAEFIVARPS
jgi:exosortase A-associated hydrolase 1